MDQAFETFDPLSITKTVLAIFEENGYSWKKRVSKPYQTNGTFGTIREETYWFGKHENRRMKFSLRVVTDTSTNTGKETNKGLDLDLIGSDEHGGYTQNHASYQLWASTGAITSQWYANYPSVEHWLTNFRRYLPTFRGQEVTDPPIRTKNALADSQPLPFLKPTFAIVERDGGARYSELLCFYRSCRVMGIASIMPDLKVSYSAASIPDAEPWFYVTGECQDKRSGATPEMIVSERDGQLVFYPVNRGKVTTSLTKLNTYIDYGTASELDAALIQRAIADFLENCNAS